MNNKKSEWAIWDEEEHLFLANDDGSFGVEAMRIKTMY